MKLHGITIALYVLPKLRNILSNFELCLYLLRSGTWIAGCHARHGNLVDFFNVTLVTFKEGTRPIVKCFPGGLDSLYTLSPN